MYSYHYLSHIGGGIQCAILLCFIALILHVTRMLRAHRIQERTQAYARGKPVLSVFLGFSLPTLMRFALLACCCAGFCTTLAATVASWLVVPESDAAIEDQTPSSLIRSDGNPWSTNGSACVAMAKICPMGYGVTKAFSYLFFFAKARTVRPATHRRGHDGRVVMGHFERLVLHATLGLFPNIIIGSIFFNYGARSDLDGVCQDRLPWFAIALVFTADFLLSVSYLYMFTAPLHAIIKANRKQAQTAATKATNGVISSQLAQPKLAFSPSSAMTSIATPTAAAAATVDTSAVPLASPQTIVMVHALSSQSLPPPPSFSFSLAANLHVNTTTDATIATAKVPVTSIQSIESMIPPIATSPPPIVGGAGPRRRGSVLLSTTSSSSTSSRSALALQQVMERNMICCVIAILVTIVNMIFVITAHVAHSTWMLAMIFTSANLDLLITALAMTVLMRSNHGNLNNTTTTTAVTTISAVTQVATTSARRDVAVTPTPNRGTRITPLAGTRTMRINNIAVPIPGMPVPNAHSNNTNVQSSPIQPFSHRSPGISSPSRYVTDVASVRTAWLPSSIASQLQSDSPETAAASSSSPLLLQ